MDSYRSKVSPITLIVNIALYVILLVLVYLKSNEFFFFILILVIVLMTISIMKFYRPKYFFLEHGLNIIHNKKETLILYKDIKVIEKNSNETGLLLGYGLKKVLISTLKGNSGNYLVSPEKEDLFINELENRVNKAKKAQNNNR